MTIRVGYIPYLNMVPFHHGFGPGPLDASGQHFDFQTLSPRLLGLEAERGAIDAGALSLVDMLRLSARYEPLESYGIGVKGSAQSVLLFSKRPIRQLQGECAVSDETATSFRLLQLILEARYGLSGVRYGRISSSLLFDGGSESILLIGDEALQARRSGIKGMSFMADLGEEWLHWQGVPFVFAQWAVRRTLPDHAKNLVLSLIQKSLRTNEINKEMLSEIEAKKRQMPSREVGLYWDGFAYELTPDHHRSIAIFSRLLENACV